MVIVNFTVERIDSSGHVHGENDMHFPATTNSGLKHGGSLLRHIHTYAYRMEVPPPPRKSKTQRDCPQESKLLVNKRQVRECASALTADGHFQTDWTFEGLQELSDNIEWLWFMFQLWRVTNWSVFRTNKITVAMVMMLNIKFEKFPV